MFPIPPESPLFFDKEMGRGEGEVFIENYSWGPQTGTLRLGVGRLGGTPVIPLLNPKGDLEQISFPHALVRSLVDGINNSPTLWQCLEVKIRYFRILGV